VRSHETDPVDARDLSDLCQKIGKIGLSGIFYLQVQSIGIDILAQEHDFLVAFRHQVPDFQKDVRHQPAAFPAPGVGDNAIGAEIVAAVHDCDQCPVFSGPMDGQALDQCVIFSYFIDAARVGQAMIQQLRQAVDVLGAENEVDKRIALANLGHRFSLRHQAPCQTNDQVWSIAPDVLDDTKMAEKAVVGIFAHTTGVQQDQVCLPRCGNRLVAHFIQQASHAFAVIFILLAAKGDDVISQSPVQKLGPFLAGLLHPAAVLGLLFQFLLGDGSD